jgi:hypothetical protein
MFSFILRVLLWPIYMYISTVNSPLDRKDFSGLPDGVYNPFSQGDINE